MGEAGFILSPSLLSLPGEEGLLIDDILLLPPFPSILSF